MFSTNGWLTVGLLTLVGGLMAETHAEYGVAGELTVSGGAMFVAWLAATLPVILAANRRSHFWAGLASHRSAFDIVLAAATLLHAYVIFWFWRTFRSEYADHPDPLRVLQGPMRTEVFPEPFAMLATTFFLFYFGIFIVFVVLGPALTLTPLRNLLGSVLSTMLLRQGFATLWFGFFLGHVFHWGRHTWAVGQDLLAGSWTSTSTFGMVAYGLFVELELYVLFKAIGVGATQDRGRKKAQ